MAASDRGPRKSSLPEPEAPAASQTGAGHHELQKTHELPEYSDRKAFENAHASANLDFIMDIPLEITVELGRTRMLIQDLLKLERGSVIELSKSAGDTLEILANNHLIARGDVVVTNEKYGIRLTEMIRPAVRSEKIE